MPNYELPEGQPEAASETNVYDESEGIIIVPSAPEESPKKEAENKAKFLSRLEGMPEETKMLIEFGYDLGKVAHRPQMREDGTRYFEHLRNVALIIMDECEMKDPDLIISSLLHDSVEDTATFGNRNLPYSQWKKTSQFRLTKTFNAEVAETVITLTKPRADGVELKDKEAAEAFYLENLAKASPKTLVVKMADRLHNLRTLAGTPPEKQKRKIAETRDHYLPIFQRVLETYSAQGKYLLDEMEKAMQTLEAA